MNQLFHIRLLLDFVAAGLFLVALAYYWLSNATHEVVGTSMFVLLVLHNVFNRRWYGTIARKRRGGKGVIGVVLNLSLLTAMLALLASSLVVSRNVFGFLPFEGGIVARDIHMVVAYVVLVIFSLHLGLHWTVVMSAVGNAVGGGWKSPILAVALRVGTACIAAFGVQSSFDMTIGSKLVLYYAMDIWDFRNDALGFFLRYASIIGLYASTAHYTTVFLRTNKRRANSVPTDVATEQSGGQN